MSAERVPARGRAASGRGARSVAPAGPVRAAAFPPSSPLPAGIAPGALKRLVHFLFCFVNSGYSHCKKPAPRPSQWLSFPAWKAPE